MDSESSSPPIWRITTFFKRRPDISEEQFYDHWYNIHSPLAIPWALHHGVLQYTQYRTPAELRQVMGSTMASDFNGRLEFDAAVDWYVVSHERFIAAYKDPYYINVIEPDEVNFVDKGQLDGGKKTVVRAYSTLGYCRDMIKDGKPMVDVSDRIIKVWEEWKEKTEK